MSKRRNPSENTEPPPWFGSATIEKESEEPIVVVVVGDMAAGEHQPKRVFYVMEDVMHGYLLFKINVKDLFYSGGGSAVPLPGFSALETRSLPSPIAQFPEVIGVPERFDFALAGATVVGVSNCKRTVTYDTRSGASAAGPELRHDKDGGVYVVPLGHRLYALKRFITVCHGSRPSGEERVLELPAGSSTRRSRYSSWRVLPEPPPDFRRLTMRLPTCQGKAYFTAGTRIWVSALQRGTYYLDTVRRAWRKEGDWKLPFCHRGLVVPELGGLCFGLCSQRYLCACDIQQSPPAVRYAWPETFPRWSDETINCLHPDGCLAYLGDGKFCIAWTMAMHDVDDKSVLRRAIHLTAVVEVIKSSGQEKGGGLRLVNTRFAATRCRAMAEWHTLFNRT